MNHRSEQSADNGSNEVAIPQVLCLSLPISKFWSICTHSIHLYLQTPISAMSPTMQPHPSMTNYGEQLPHHHAVSSLNYRGRKGSNSTDHSATTVPTSSGSCNIIVPCPCHQHPHANTYICGHRHPHLHSTPLWLAASLG